MTVNPRQSFKLKLCISIFAVATVTFLLVITACMYFVRQEVRNDLDALVDAKLNYALRALDEGLATTQVSAENLESISRSPLVKYGSRSLIHLH